MLGKLLTRAGYAVRSVKSTAKTLAFVNESSLVSESSPDEVVQLSAQVDSSSGIAMTGYNDREDLHRSRQAGFATHLVKPIDFESWQAVITRFLP